MRLILIIVAVLLSLVQSINRSCLSKRAAIGDPRREDEFITDYKMLKYQATKDMRLKQMNICFDRDRQFRAV